MGWLTGWKYRKPIIVAYGSVDYQTKITVDSAAGADASNHAHCGGHVAADLDDLRFTQSNGTTLMPYWIESTSGTESTIWVKHTEATPATAYMYYGGTETAYSTTTTFIKYHGAATASFIDSLDSLGTAIRFRAYVRALNAVHNIQFGVRNTDTSDRICIQSYTTTNLAYFRTMKDTAETIISEAPSFTNGTWYILEFLYSTTAAHGYVAGNEISTGSTTNLPVDNMALYLLMIDVNTGEQGWSFISKYAATEPSFTFLPEQRKSGFFPFL